MLCFTLFILQVFASTCADPVLPDGTAVPVSEAVDGTWVLPHCRAVGLLEGPYLKCVAGEWNFQVNDGELAQVNQNEFCFPATDELETFWTKSMETLDPYPSTSPSCPSNTECLKYDRFENDYISGQQDQDISTFLGIRLDEASSLEYDVTIGDYDRSFTFDGGRFEGRIFEYSYGTHVVLNLQEAHGEMPIYIQPCTEDDSCKYVMYRPRRPDIYQGGETEIEMLLGQKTIGAPTRIHGTLQRSAQTQQNNDRMLRQRLTKLNGKRRSLTDLGWTIITVTFLYDPAISDGYTRANQRANEIISAFNSAAREKKIKLVKVRTLNVNSGRFRVDNVGKSSKCAPDDKALTRCRYEFNKLPAHQKTDLVHCFMDNMYSRGLGIATRYMGCAHINREVSMSEWDVTSQGTNYHVKIGVHELAHNLGASHDDSTCRCTANTWFGCWWYECTLMDKYVVHTNHNTAIEFSSATLKKMYNTGNAQFASMRTRTQQNGDCETNSNHACRTQCWGQEKCWMRDRFPMEYAWCWSACNCRNYDKVCDGPDNWGTGTCRHDSNHPCKSECWLKEKCWDRRERMYSWCRSNCNCSSWSKVCDGPSSETSLAETNELRKSNKALREALESLTD